MKSSALAANSLVGWGCATVLLFLVLVGCKSDPAAAPADFCATAKSANTTCQSPSDCDVTLASGCKSLSGALSDASIAATKDCLDSGVCGVSACVAVSAKSATPTDAHAQLAQDFCTYCAPSLPDCVANFYKRAAKGAGLSVLPYAAAIASAVDAACTGQEGCQAAFQQCATAAVADAVGAAVDADTASCITTAFNRDTSEVPLGPDGKPQAVTCTAANCDGCCRDDKCETGDVTSACGTAAGACEICSGMQQCLSGKCKEPCGPSNCRGCCDGDTCVDGVTTATCGEKGASCETCAGTFVCSNHTCVDGSCVATCTSGCCTTAGCQLGTLASACGTGGAACTVCGSGRTCTTSKCQLDTTSLWDVYISFAIVPSVDKNGAYWDLLNGAPDPYLFVYTSLGAASHSGSTTTQTDTTVPFWAETPVKGVTAAELLSNLSIEIWDYDETNNDDFIGGCKIPLVASQFDGSLQEINCPATASGVAVTVDYRINPHAN